MKNLALATTMAYAFSQLMSAEAIPMRRGLSASASASPTPTFLPGPDPCADLLMGDKCLGGMLGVFGAILIALTFITLWLRKGGCRKSDPSQQVRLLSS